MGIFDIFKSDEKIFWKKMENCEKAYPITLSNPFNGSYSLAEIERAQTVINDARVWWINNRERLRHQDWMNANIWHDTNNALQLPSSMF
jgi:hypothetical protein